VAAMLVATLASVTVRAADEGAWLRVATRNFVLYSDAGEARARSLAEHLEALWNTLSTECSFRLLCGYSSSHFDDERSAGHLDRICAQHTNSGERALFHIPTR